MGVDAARVRLAQLDHRVGHRCAVAIEDADAETDALAGHVGSGDDAALVAGPRADMKEGADGL